MTSRRQIDDLVKTIVREFRPERIILFGSYAYGMPKPDSDVDLLIQMPFSGHPARQASAIRLKTRPPFPVDLIVRTAQEVRRRLERGDCVMREIVEKGEVLYESGNKSMARQGGG